MGILYSFGGRLRPAVALLYLAHFFLLIGFQRVFSGLRLFFFGQLHLVIDHDATTDRFAHVDVLLIIVMLITTRDKHYYDEEDIDIGKPVSCKVVVNHTVELTEEEKAEARRNAIRKAESEAYAKLAKAKSKPKKIEDNKLMPSLF